jgi:glucose-6-phosphate 1-epimerase
VIRPPLPLPMPSLSPADAPSILITAPDGACARIYLDGAHVTSWIPAGGDEQLFVSARARYGPGHAIRGGIPICWPQFGASGPLKQHGFARVMRWTVLHSLVEAHEALAVLRLTESAESRALWPFAFVTELRVTVGGPTLRVELAVHNTDEQPISFTAALHPYFRVRDARAVQVEGLTGMRYRDALRDGAEFTEQERVLEIPEAIDRVYFDTPDTVVLREPHRAVQIQKVGFPETVVWNPGAAGTGSRDDFAPGDERQMVCVEAAAVRPPIVLAPGDRWVGVQTMTI